MAKRKRTKSKPTRSKRKSKKGAGKKPAPFFSRAAINPGKKTRKKPKASAAWTKWGRSRVSTKTENDRRKVVKLLEARGVYPEVAHKIAYEMEPDRYYILRIYGVHPSDPDGNVDLGALMGETPVIQATFIGSGERLWHRCIGYASRAPIEHVEIDELDTEKGGYIDRPFWYTDKSIKTVTGERVYGSGTFDEYRDRQKTGRPKSKKGRGSTAEERRKDRRRKNAALKRKSATNNRYNELIAKWRKTGDVKYQHEAARLRERSKRSRKVDL